jgi:hypothetical protein
MHAYAGCILGPGVGSCELFGETVWPASSLRAGAAKLGGCRSRMMRAVVLCRVK